MLAAPLFINRTPARAHLANLYASEKTKIMRTAFVRQEVKARCSISKSSLSVGQNIEGHHTDIRITVQEEVVHC